MFFGNNCCTSRCRRPVAPERLPNKCQCVCECTEAEVEKEKPQMVRAQLNTVMDSCCTTEDFCREITVCCPDIFDPCELEVGSVIDVELAGDITFREINREKDDCVCVSSVRFNVPVRLFGTASHCCNNRSIVRNITILRSASLCCARDSVLNTVNSRILAASAVVSDICGNEVTILLCLLFRSCLQQVLLREFTWEATPVCTHNDCLAARTTFVDPCDLICGCSEASKTCPQCD